ncbi:MAG: putative endopeptidase [Dokdonia donghaensis]|jgi:putative endopeptidase
MKKLWYFSMIAASFIACEQSEQKNETHPEVVFDGISEQIAPGDDFYNHVNKNWYDNAVIADDQVGVGAYRFLNIPQQELLKNILEEVSEQSHDKGSVEQLVGDFYASGMDTLSIDKRGITPIQPLLEKIDGTSTTEELMDVVANQIKTGDYSFLAPYISPDQKNSKLNILHLAQTALGLPDRDYYFNEDPSSVAIQDAYKTYLTTLFELVGDIDATANAAIVYAIEKELADSHKTRIQRRVIKDNYNKVSVVDLDNGHNQIDWKHIFTTLGTDIDSLNVRQPAYYDKVNDVLASTSLKDLKLYVKAKSLSNHDNILSTPFQDASFAYTKVISGQSEQQSRTKRMVRNVDRQIGFALGQLYVKRYFNEEAKERALDLVNNFQKSLEQRIENLEWMSDSTKVKAKEKLFAINKKIGYPDVWRTYDVEINRDQFLRM